MQSKLQVLSSIAGTRRSLAHGLGKSYEGQRDLYTALGYKKSLLYTDFLQKFERGDIAKRIVTAYPDATWRGLPTVFENEEPQDTKFEEEWTELAEAQKIYHYFTRADKLCGIGRYSILFLGLSDAKTVEDMKTEVSKKKGTKLLYLQPYSEENAKIDTWDKDPASERYGLPLTYKLKVQNLNNVSVAPGIREGASKSGTSVDMIVHWTRVIHIAENLLESNVYGPPRLECIYNRLENLEIIVGGSAEGMWRAGFPGIAFEMDPTADAMSTTEATAFDDQIDEYIHTMRRDLRLQGMKANSLDPNIESPEQHVDVQLKLISGATGIPVRILTGSERGELASTQDKENWADRVAERRDDFATPVMLKPFIDRMIMAGVLSEPKDGYEVTWPEIDSLSDKDQADILLLRTKAIGEYVKSGASELIPPEVFLKMFLNMDQDEIDAIIDQVNEMLELSKIDEEAMKEEERALEEEERTRTEEERLRLKAEKDAEKE